MRPIDADALSEELSTLAMMITGLRAGKGVLNTYMKEYRKSVLRIVDEQPTIDPESLRPKGEWISVEDRLPEKSGHYLIFADIDYMNVVLYSARHKAFNAWDGFDDARNSIDVTHWMPLPEPPKADMRGEGE